MDITDFFIGQSTIPVWTWYPMNVDKDFWPDNGDKVIVVNERKILNSDKCIYDYCVATANICGNHLYFDIQGNRKYKNLVRWTKIMDKNNNTEE